MSRVYEIRIKDTPFYRDRGVDRYRVLRQQGMVDRYEVTICLDGADLRYVSSATYWAPRFSATQIETTGYVAAPPRNLPGYSHPGLGLGIPQTVERTWRNPNCSLTIWTSKVFTVPVEIALKNGQIIRTRHRLTFNEDFRTRIHRAHDIIHHDFGVVSYGVQEVGETARERGLHADTETHTIPSTDALEASN